jgi:hypothetical protein
MRRPSASLAAAIAQRSAATDDGVLAIIRIIAIVVVVVVGKPERRGAGVYADRRQVAAHYALHRRLWGCVVLSFVYFFQFETCFGCMSTYQNANSTRAYDAHLIVQRFGSFARLSC